MPSLVLATQSWFNKCKFANNLFCAICISLADEILYLLMHNSNDLILLSVNYLLCPVFSPLYAFTYLIFDCLDEPGITIGMLQRRKKRLRKISSMPKSL